jgi:hypothetical protein
MVAIMCADESDGDSAKSRASRVVRIFAWLAGLALVLFVLDLLGVPVADWIRQLLKEVRAVPATAIAGGIALETLQTTFAAVAWLTIHPAYQHERLTLKAGRHAEALRRGMTVVAQRRIRQRSPVGAGVAANASIAASSVGKKWSGSSGPISS